MEDGVVHNKFKAPLLFNVFFSPSDKTRDL